LGVITLKPEATSMLSLFWVLPVVEQPIVNANRDMTLITLNESRTCFMILGSFQVALFLICYRRPLVPRGPAISPQACATQCTPGVYIDRPHVDAP